VRGRRGWLALLPWALCAVSLGLLVLSNVFRWMIRNEVLPPEHVDWQDGTIAALGFAGIPIVGALIASRLPDNPIGWVWCAAGLANGLSELPIPAVQVLGWPRSVAWVVGTFGFLALVGLLSLVFLLFPTGRLPSPPWRWVAGAAVTLPAVLMLAVLFVHNPEDPTAATPWALRGTTGRYLLQTLVVGVHLLFGLAVVSMSSLVFRFRRASPVERRQLTWFLYAAAANAVVLILGIAGLVPPGRFDTILSAAAIALLPVAVGIAVLRYRLFEIDRIVSRTVSYGLLTAGLIGLYLLVVALLRPLLEPVTGSSSLAVAGSTLAVAAAFNPARRRLQAAVDRRFDRARYDADRAVQAFAARLRTQVDLDEVTAGLRDTVVTTVAPTRVAVWLRVPSGRGRS
jgi:hypothetical protein